MPFGHLLDNNDMLPDSKLNIIKGCNCCEVHKRNRPSTFEPWIETCRAREECEKAPSNPNACNCDCRHVARFICRSASCENIQ